MATQLEALQSQIAYLKTKPFMGQELQAAERSLATYLASNAIPETELDVAASTAAALGQAGAAESLGADIVSRDTGKAATKQKQAKRMAGMTGATSPRTRQQTASLLSSASAAPSTLLG